MNAALLFGPGSMPSSVSSVSEKSTSEAPQDPAFRQAFNTVLQDKQADAPLALEQAPPLQNIDNAENQWVVPTSAEENVESLPSVVIAEAVTETSSSPLTSPLTDATGQALTPPASLSTSFSMAELTAELFRSTLQPISETLPQPPDGSAATVSITGSVEISSSTAAVESALAPAITLTETGVDVPLETAAAALEQIEREPANSDEADQADHADQVDQAHQEAAINVTPELAVEAADASDLSEAQEAEPAALFFSVAGLALTSGKEEKPVQTQLQRLFSPQGFGSLSQGLNSPLLKTLAPVSSSVTDPLVAFGAALSVEGMKFAALQEGGGGVPSLFSMAPEQILAQSPNASLATANGVPATQLPGSAAALLLEASTQLEARFEVFKQVEQHMYLLRHHQQREIQIQLEPAQLGKLNLRLQQEGHLFQLHITAENVVAKEILEAHIQQLKDQFSQQGFELDSVNVNVRSDTSGSSDSETSQSQEMATFFVPRAVAMPFSLVSDESDGGAPFLNYGSAAPAYYYHQVNYFA